MFPPTEMTFFCIIRTKNHYVSIFQLLVEIDAMLRQVSEAVALGNAKVGTIINTKKEWNYVQLPKVVIDNGEDNFRNAVMPSLSSLGLSVSASQ